MDLKFNSGNHITARAEKGGKRQKVKGRRRRNKKGVDKNLVQSGDRRFNRSLWPTTLAAAATNVVNFRIVVVVLFLLSSITTVQSFFLPLSPGIVVILSFFKILSVIFFSMFPFLFY